MELPITNIDDWNFNNIDIITTNDGKEVIAYLYLLDQTKTRDFINKTVHSYALPDTRGRIEGISIEWKGNPFNIYNYIKQDKK